MSLASPVGSDDLRRRTLTRCRRRDRMGAALGLALAALVAGGCAGPPVAHAPGAAQPTAPRQALLPVTATAPATTSGDPGLGEATRAASLAAPAPPVAVHPPEVQASRSPDGPDAPPAVSPGEPPAAVAHIPVAPSVEAPPADAAVDPEPAEVTPAAVVAVPVPMGWLVPERPEIQEVLAEFTGPRRRTVADALERAERYLPMIREALAEAELPPELASLPLVESHYRPDARSHADAVGLWQFIDTTARGSGLRVDWWVDERLDPELATHAAASHLRELHDRFGDWELALAAYNAGPGGVARALERSGARGFWDLSVGDWLRAETRRYLPKFYASVLIAADPERFGFPRGGGDLPREYDTVPVSAPVDLYTVGRKAGLRLDDLQRLNPALKRRCTPPGGQAYPLRVPAGRGAQVAEVLAGLEPDERTDFLRYRVAAGDSLWAIARRFDTRPGAIAELNGVADPRLLRPGQQLVVPSRRGRAGLKGRASGVDRRSGFREYQVRSGDTVGAVARLHGVSVDDVLRWNGLGPRGLIRPGDRLFVGAAAGAPVGGLARARARVHVVASGDTLWGISRRYGVSLEDLRRANGLGPGAVLRPGDELLVGSGSSSGG